MDSFLDNTASPLAQNLVGNKIGDSNFDPTLTKLFITRYQSLTCLGVRYYLCLL